LNARRAPIFDVNSPATFIAETSVAQHFMNSFSMVNGRAVILVATVLKALFRRGSATVGITGELFSETYRAADLKANADLITSQAPHTVKHIQR
jgi:hypothetical protein